MPCVYDVLFLYLYLILAVVIILQMWADLIQKSKDGGLDVIETYVFWNAHEPVQNQVGCSFLSHILLILSVWLVRC
jgi:hypothetical protein